MQSIAANHGGCGCQPTFQLWAWPRENSGTILTLGLCGSSRRCGAVAIT